MAKAQNDFFTDKENLTTSLASVSTREIQVIESIANKMYTCVDIDEAYRIDAKPFVERPFYAGSLEFSNTSPRYSWLTCPIKNLPGDVIRSNPSLLNAMKIGSLYRADLVLNISMAGTITHAGKILVAALPPLPATPGLLLQPVDWINIALSGPHAYLHANEATSVMLSIPWYCNSDLATLDMDTSTITSLDITPINGNYSTLAFIVMNPLAPSTGSSQRLTIVIEACFKNLDIVIPTPRLVQWTPQSGLGSLFSGLKETVKKGTKAIAGDFIDGATDWLLGWTGLHNPNVPIIHERDIIIARNLPNTVDAPQFFEKLDPSTSFNRVVKAPIFGSDVDEMSISHITSKKQLLGTFVVNQNDPVGTLYWSRPISPFQGGILNSQNEILCVNNIELMHSMHRAWRGGLSVTIESVMNNKQQVKLRLLKMYNPTLEAITSIPVYQTIANAPSALMEFTQGGQEHIVSLPYLCRNDLTPCSEELSFEGVWHGMYYVYLAQPLANSDGSPVSIEFNVYMHGDEDLTFYGYVSKALYEAAFPLEYIPPIPPKKTFQAQSGKDINSIRVMNEPQEQNNAIAVDNKNVSASHFDRLLPNLDLRPLLRRMYPQKGVEAFSIQPGQVVTELIPLNRVLGEEVWTSLTNQYTTPIGILSRMFYSKTAGFKFQIKCTDRKLDDGNAGTSFLNISVMYVPPNFSLNSTTATVTGCPINPNFLDPGANPSYNTPFPFQDIPIVYNTTDKVYEFVIPDVTYYKFMGSPYKFFSSSSTTPQPLSTNDFGSIYLRYVNTSIAIGSAFTRTLYVGLSDESRFGHHAIASPFIIEKSQSPYYSFPGTLPSGIKPPAMYYGGFL